MKYDNITKARFIKRPNRFIAEVELEHGAEKRIETVHVKNTGRCKELLLKGAEVWLTAPGTPGRKTKYDLVAVRKQNGLLINMDSQAPNKVVREWLERQGFDVIRAEYTYGSSRVDFYMERCVEGDACSARIEAGSGCDDRHQVQKYLMEVKGCTLEMDGIGYFPDAPTERGVKHIRELIRAQKEGYRAVLGFVIQMDGVTEVRPNVATHPEFGQALEEARNAGVEIWMLPCHVLPDELWIL